MTTRAGLRSAKAALYARVSLGDGRQTVAPQLDALRAYAKARGWSATEYVDLASGVNAKRPALGRLLDDARAGRLEVVVAVRLDRLGRSTRNVLDLVAELAELGVALAFVDLGIDTTTPSGKLVLTVLAGVAEMERALLIERTKAGIASARRRGRHPGRPRALSDDQLDEARRLRAKGWTVGQLSRRFDVPRTTLSGALRRSN